MNTIKIQPPVSPPPTVGRVVRAKSAAVPAAQDDAPVAATDAGPLAMDALSVALDLSDDAMALLAGLHHRRREPLGADAERDPGEAWMDALLEDDGAERIAALRQLLASDASTAERLALLGQLFPDPSDAALALAEMLSNPELSHEERKRLEALRDEVEAAHDGEEARQRRDRKAGVNVGAKARLVALRSGLDAKALRSCYRDFLSMELEPISQYEWWMEQFGFDSRMHVLDFVERALVADIYALDPSCSALEFGNLLRYIHRLGSLRSADARLLSSGWDDALMQQLRVDRKAWLLAMFAIVRDTEKLAELFETTFGRASITLSIAERGRLVQAMRRALSSLSPAMWAGHQEYVATFAMLDALADRAATIEFRNEPSRMTRLP